MHLVDNGSETDKPNKTENPIIGDHLLFRKLMRHRSMTGLPHVISTITTEITTAIIITEHNSGKTKDRTTEGPILNKSKASGGGVTDQFVISVANSDILQIFVATDGLNLSTIDLTHNQIEVEMGAMPIMALSIQLMLSHQMFLFSIPTN
ncbi:hypothetical protein niasHT_025121 [Heterodera trifolii]|uniref:Uncharacterized protein n=1 Tax=Heterodera trifolii TaxID=157864 RepID=A0ABD2K1G5_9BILA